MMATDNPRIHDVMTKDFNRQSLRRRTTLKIVLFYTVIACLWIYFSDTLAALFITDPALLTKAQTVKGWLYVIVTAVLLYLYLNHCLYKLHSREEELEAQRRAIRARIEERFEQLNTLFDSMSAVIYVADLETYELLYVNRFAAEHFGKNWQGQKCYHYLQEGIEGPCRFCTNPQLIVNGETGAPVVWEFLNTRNNRWYECFDKAIRWPDGRLVRLEIALDITERKELEKIKDDLLSGVSHEMRTPLTAISGFAELLLNERELPEEHGRHVEIIAREADKLTDLINRFLDIRRLKIDRSRINYENLDVAQLLRKARSCCQDCREHHDIEIHCPPGLSAYGNAKELSQVFKQLVENACRYSPRGGQITIRAERIDAEVLVSVTDQGIGIPKHELANIFEPFHRLDTGDTRTTGGVGLGLCIAREIVTLHGGSLIAESTEGAGSTFTVRLPQPGNNSVAA